ncbi:MAG: YigZ family protein [Bacteroidales bacterium]|nr:YigZ family protein [Bacteroidales bacterium]
MENDVFNTIEGESSGFYAEKGSKFHAFAFPVVSEEQVKEIHQELKKKYYDARHHVYAFVIGADKSTYRASDDGEPSNSSGMPVLGQIRSFELTNVLIVVVRYFGGTKLGVPGLINAYKTAAKEALQNAKIIEQFVMQQASVIFNYDEMSFVMKTLSDYDAEIIEQVFLENCKILFQIRLSFYDNLLNSLKQNHKIEIKNKI